MHIRTATQSDRVAVRDVHRAAFPGAEGELVSSLAVSLLTRETAPPTLSWVAETRAGVVGHVAFSPVAVAGVEEVQGYILAPLAVRPDVQKRHIGTELVETGIGRLSGMGVDVVLVYGDPEYYGRFGFSAHVAERYAPPHRLEYPLGWQGLALTARATREARVRITCVPSLDDAALW